MFFNGIIRINWLEIAATDGLVGLSKGDGVPEDFIESDISEFGFIGDFDHDCDVELVDFAEFALAWLTEPNDAEWNPGCDISIVPDDSIDERDLAVFANNWLEGLNIPRPLPGRAKRPDPRDGETGVSPAAHLSWVAGSNATSHDVYFGTTSPGAFQGNQTATTFDPSPMALNTTYYWRIDEINSSGKTIGKVWSFTTTSGPPPPK